MAHALLRDIIPTPLTGAVNVKDVKPVIEHPHASRLLHVSQLGGSNIAFPGANHSRFEHALGTMARTKLRAYRWRDAGAIREEDILPLTLAGFCHDIGHAALSHILEDQLEISHHENGRRMLLEMRAVFEEVGCDLDHVLAILEGGDRIGAAVTDKNFGTDKFDYLERDAFHAGVTFLDLSVIEQFVMLTERGIAIDRAGIDLAKLVLQFYVTAYGGFYMNKSSLIVQRFLAKAFAAMLEEGVIARKEPLRMTDQEFFACLFAKEPIHPEQNRITQFFKGTLRSSRLQKMTAIWRACAFPKTVVSFRDLQSCGAERIAGKPIHVAPIEESMLERAALLAEPEIGELEREIAQHIHLPSEDVTVVKPPTKTRFTPTDVLLWDHGRFSTLSNEVPEFYASLRRSWTQYAALRVCVPLAARQEAHERKTQIEEIVTEHLITLPFPRS